MNIYSLKRSTQIAIIAGTGSPTEEKTVSGTTPLTLSDSVAENIHSINVKGHSTVSAGSIVSVGDAKWAVVDLGSLTYTYYAPSQYFYVEYAVCAKSPALYSSLYTNIGEAANPVMEAAPDLSVGWVNKTAFVEIKFKNTAYTDATEFKNAMTGVMLYYPLADATGSTPTLGIVTINGSGQGAAATITTGLPLRGLSTDICDVLDNTKVTAKTLLLEGKNLSWGTVPIGDKMGFRATFGTYPVKPGRTIMLCSSYTANNTITDRNDLADGECSSHIQDVPYKSIFVRDDSFDGNLSAFETAVKDVEFLVELAEPVETSLTSPEVAALSALKTYSPTTVISATDNPSVTVTYLGTVATRTAPKKRTSRKKKS